MKLYARTTAALSVVLLGASVASAAVLNTRPIAINPGSLNGYFTGKGQTIDAAADQKGNALWTTTVSHNSTFTLMLELAGNANSNAVGIYNDGNTGTLYQVFPGNAAPGWFAVTSFDVGTPGKVVVNLFDNNAMFQSQTIHNGVNSASFGFYLQGPGGTFFSEDDENAGVAQNVVYMGTGTSMGNWWLCWEDTAYGASDKDFDDLVMFLESVNQPTPVAPTTWGGIKSLYSK